MHKLPPEHTDPMENLYRTSFEDFRAEPSEDLLSKIKNNLATQQQTSAKHKPVFSWFVFSAVFLVLSFAGIYYYIQHKHPLSSSKNNDTKLIKKETLAPAVLKEEKEALTAAKNSKTSVKKDKVSIPVLRKNEQPILPTEESLVKTLDSTTQERDLKNELVKPIPQNKINTEDEQEVDFYQKHTKSHKDSLRNLFDKK